MSLSKQIKRQLHVPTEKELEFYFFRQNIKRQINLKAKLDKKR